MEQYNIDYDTYYKRNFKLDVKGAVKVYLNPDKHIATQGSVFGFILYPQALNPFLRIMESLGESGNIVILPAFDNDGEEINKPAYLVIKISGEDNFITNITTEKKIKYN